MRYEDYRGPEIQEEPRPPVPVWARIGHLLALIINSLFTIFFTFTTAGFWMGWREGGSPIYYAGIYIFGRIVVLSCPFTGWLLRKKLSPRTTRWIRWGGCFLLYLLFVAVVVP